MDSIAAELWGCPGLTVGVHRYNNGIGAPLWQMAAPPVPDPKFNKLKYLISEKDVRFVIVVNIESDLIPVNNVLIGDILSVDLWLDGFHVSALLWDTRILMRDHTRRVAILASPANPKGEAKAFKFSEPAFALDDNNHEREESLGTIKVVVSHALGHIDNEGLPLMEDHTRLFPDHSTVPQGRFSPQITPHVITYQNETHPAGPPAGMMKTATILRPCSFNFEYGAPRTIEYLTGLHIVMPGDRDFPTPASRPPQAARDNNQDRQNALGPQPEDPRLVNAGHQMMDVLRNYAHDYAGNVIYNAIRQGTLLHPDAPRGPPVAGPSNPHVFHNQNPPAPTVQAHPGGMGHHQGPPPVTGQPPNTGRTKAEEIDMLRQFSGGLRLAPRPVTVGDLQQPDRYAGLPLTSAHPNVTTGFTAINAGSTGSSVGAGPDASAAARAGWEGRRLRAAGARGHSAGRADSTAPRVAVPRRLRPTPLTDSNTLAASGSSTGYGVPGNRLADGTGAAHTHQALAVTSTTGRRPLDEGLHRVNRSGENIMANNSSHVDSSARGTVTGLDSTHAAVSASNVPASSAALASGGDNSGVGPADPNSGSEGSGANTSAFAEGVTHVTSAGEDAASVTKVDDQDSNNAQVPVSAQDTESVSISASNTAVPVNNTAESGSESGHSPPHKKQRVDGGDTAGDNDV